MEKFKRSNRDQIREKFVLHVTKNKRAFCRVPNRGGLQTSFKRVNGPVCFRKRARRWGAWRQGREIPWWKRPRRRNRCYRRGLRWSPFEDGHRHGQGLEFRRQGRLPTGHRATRKLRPRGAAAAAPTCEEDRRKGQGKFLNVAQKRDLQFIVRQVLAEYFNASPSIPINKLILFSD